MCKMKTLYFTTSSYMGDLLVTTEEGDFPVTMEEVKGEYKPAYIHGKAQKAAGYDIPVFLRGDMRQLDRPVEEQDIVMLLSGGKQHAMKALVKKSTIAKWYYLVFKDDDIE